MNFHLLEVLVHERQSRLLREAEGRRLRRRLRASREPASSGPQIPRNQTPPHGLLHDCGRLAWLIDQDGVPAVADELQLFLARVKAAGVPAVLVQVVSDPTQPAIARARAFGRICRAVTAGDERADGPARSAA